MDQEEYRAAATAPSLWDDPWELAFKNSSQSVKNGLTSPSFRLRGLHDFNSLASALHDVRLRGDTTVRVYKHAAIEAKRFKIAHLSPLSLYILRPRIRELLRLFWNLQARGQHMFDLVGMMDYEIFDTTHRLIPPIIETYQEPTTNSWVSAIIDGLHRVSVARALGIEELWAIHITRVPSSLPPIALPVSWNEVAMYDAVPPTDQKRRYRYGQGVEADPGNLLGITAENYQYFLYRDFGNLGSTGIRNPTCN